MYIKDNLRSEELYTITCHVSVKHHGSGWSIDRTESRRRLEQFVESLNGRAVSLSKTVELQPHGHWSMNDQGAKCIVMIAGDGVSLSPQEGIHEGFLKGCLAQFQKQSLSNERFTITKR